MIVTCQIQMKLISLISVADAKKSLALNAPDAKNLVQSRVNIQAGMYDQIRENP